MKKKVIQECLDISIRNNNPLNHPQWACYKHFSFIIQRNKIVDWGTNRAGTPFANMGYEAHCKIHSEVEAYRKARGIMDKSLPFEVVNIRLIKNGQIRSSCPCKCCWNFLKNLGCKQISFTTDMGNFANLKF